MNPPPYLSFMLMVWQETRKQWPWQWNANLSYVWAIARFDFCNHRRAWQRVLWKLRTYIELENR